MGDRGGGLCAGSSDVCSSDLVEYDEANGSGGYLLEESGDWAGQSDGIAGAHLNAADIEWEIGGGACAPGVQTCALPIWLTTTRRTVRAGIFSRRAATALVKVTASRAPT